jgi:hypothetical protein
MARRGLDFFGCSPSIENSNSACPSIRFRPFLGCGRTGTGHLMVGSLAHLLKNRFYIGEVVYRGETHRGEHEPVLDRHLFEAVQAKRAASSVQRRPARPCMVCCTC